MKENEIWLWSQLHSWAYPLPSSPYPVLVWAVSLPPWLLVPFLPVVCGREDLALISKEMCNLGIRTSNKSIKCSWELWKVSKLNDAFIRTQAASRLVFSLVQTTSSILQDLYKDPWEITLPVDKGRGSLWGKSFWACIGRILTQAVPGKTIACAAKGWLRVWPY